jgi:hypothetical protein
MDIRELMLQAAEDELAEYRTEALRRQNLRRKLNFQMPAADRRVFLKELEEELKAGGMVAKVLCEQRQAAALPLYGLCGLALLVGFIGYGVPAYIVAALAVVGALAIQRIGWKLQSKVLLVQTMKEMETQ